MAAPRAGLATVGDLRDAVATMPRISALHLCSVASEIPYSCDSCRMAMVFGGSIRFSTAALRSGDIPNHHPIPPASEIEKKESSGQLP